MLIPPILTCIADQDSKIRYLACESLYNLAKAARGHVLRFFNEIFDSLSKVLTPHPRCSLAHPVLSPDPDRITFVLLISLRRMRTRASRVRASCWTG